MECWFNEWLTALVTQLLQVSESVRKTLGIVIPGSLFQTFGHGDEPPFLMHRHGSFDAGFTRVTSHHGIPRAGRVPNIDQPTIWRP